LIRLLPTPSADLCLALITGILTGRQFGYSTASVFIITFFTLCIIGISRIPLKLRILIPVFSAAGFLLISGSEEDFLKPGHISSFAPQNNVTIQGKTATGFRYFGESYQFHLETESISFSDRKNPAHGLLLVTVYRRDKMPLPGDTVTLKNVKLMPITSFRNIDGFDYSQYMEDKGIGARTAVPHSSKITIESLSGFQTDPYRLGEKLRRKAHQYIQSHFRAELAPVAESMTVGITDRISGDARWRFTTSGLAHLLAISGLHVGFISALSYAVLYFFFFHLFGKFHPVLTLTGFHKKAALFFSLFVCFVFVLSTGIKISAVRAGIMVGVYLVSALIGREKEIYNSLALSAIIILLFDPAALFSASFQMSYIAVFGILLLFAGEGTEKEEIENIRTASLVDKVGKFLVISIKISIAVTFATAPVVLANFFRVPLGGLLANIFAVPMTAVAVPSTLIGVFLYDIHPAVGSLVAWFGILFFGGINFIADFFSRLDLLTISGPALPLPVVIIYYLVLLSWFFRHRYRVWFSALLFILLVPFFVSWPRENTEIRFFDVGQGDSSLIMLKDGRNILIDGGINRGRLDIGEYVIVPALARLKVRKLDAVIATHGDDDHAGGLLTVMKRIQIAKYYDNDQPKHTALLEQLRSVAKEKGIPVSSLRAGDFVGMKGDSLMVIHPDPRFAAENPNSIDNDLSIALMISSEGSRILHAGDMEKNAEKRLLERGIDLSADVLKVGHHGGQTSATASFLNKVNPSLAIISSGRYNRWKMPSKTTVERLEKKGITIMDTQKEGEIVLTLKDGEILAHSFVNREPVKIGK